MPDAARAGQALPIAIGHPHRAGTSRAMDRDGGADSETDGDRSHDSHRIHRRRQHGSADGPQPARGRARGARVRRLAPEALAEAVQAGASEAVSLADAVTGAEMVITMVPEGRHVRAVYLGDGGNDGIIGHAPREALLADCSTIDIATARQVAATASESGYEMIDAPVSGGVTGAEAGTLTFMVGGSEAGFERARSVLAAMGRNVAHIGGPGHGQATKICNNMMAGIAIIAASEVFCLGEALGLDAKKLYDVLATSTGQTRMMDAMHPVPGIVETAPSNRGYAPRLQGRAHGQGPRARTERGDGHRHKYATRCGCSGNFPDAVQERRRRARLQRGVQAPARGPVARMIRSSRPCVRWPDR